MKIWLIFLLAVFPFGQLGRFNVSGTEVVLQLNDIAVAIFVIASILKNPDRIFLEIKTNVLSKPVFLFIIAMIVSLLVNIPNYTARQLLISSLYPIRWIFYAGLYFSIAVFSKEQKVEMFKYLKYAILLIAAAGVLQFIFLPDVSFLKEFHWDDHYFRAVSTFLDPGFTGAILVLGLILIFKFQISNLKLAMTLIFIAMALTYSRASYLTYLVSFGVISIYKKSMKMFIVAVLALAITIPLLPKSSGEGTKLARENSVWSRLHNWQESVQIWQTHPIFGIGYDAYRYVKPNTTLQSHSGAGADSSLLLILATTGILGLSAYFFLLYKIWKTHRKNALIMASFGGILIHSFFNNTLFYPWVMEWLWILLAISKV